MERLEFENYEEFASEISDTFNSLEDEFSDVSIIAKYHETKEIIRELLGLGYDLCNITFEMPDYDGYDDEYILGLSSDGVWCDKFKGEDGYFTDEADIIYVMDNCSSMVIRNIYSDHIYEVNVDADGIKEDSGCTECESCGKCYDDDFYSVNGERVDKHTYDKYVSQFAPELVRNDKDTSNYCNYIVSVKSGIDADEALKIIADMEQRMSYINDMFRKIDIFTRLFNW